MVYVNKELIVPIYEETRASIVLYVLSYEQHTCNPKTKFKEVGLAYDTCRSSQHSVCFVAIVHSILWCTTMLPTDVYILLFMSAHFALTV